MAEPETVDTAKAQQKTDSAEGISGASALKAIAHLQQVAETLVADAAKLAEDKPPQDTTTEAKPAAPKVAERPTAGDLKTVGASAQTGAPEVDWRARLRSQVERMVWSQAAAAAVMALAIGGGTYLGLMDYLDRKETQRIAAEDALRHPPETAVEKELRAKIAELTLEMQAVRSQMNKVAQDTRAVQTQAATGAAAAQTVARVEKLEKDLAAKLESQIARVERLERLAADPIVTSSIPKGEQKEKGQPTSAAGAPAPVRQGLRTPDPTMKPSQFVLRGVHNGVAVVQTRRGMLEVAPGDTIPGVGRVRSIEKMDGRWVLVMQDGYIDQDED